MNAIADDQILKQIVERLVPMYRPRKIYLFGSLARGDAGPDSDYDILLVVPNEERLSLQRIAEAHLALWGVDAAVDVLVWREEDFNSRLHLQASLPSAVVREGKLLYAA